MTIGQRIKEARKSAGLTQRELAEKAGTATGTIQQYELGKRQPRIEQFQAIADVLNVDVNWLMNGYTLAQRDQAFRDFVKKRFSEVEVWKTRLDEIGQDLGKLNDEGQVEAVKRVKELTEIPRYQVQEPPTAPPQDPPAPQEGKDTTSPADSPQRAQELPTGPSVIVLTMVCPLCARKITGNPVTKTAYCPNCKKSFPLPQE